MRPLHYSVSGVPGVQGTLALYLCIFVIDEEIESLPKTPVVRGFAASRVSTGTPTVGDQQSFPKTPLRSRLSIGTPISEAGNENDDSTEDDDLTEDNEEEEIDPADLVTKGNVRKAHMEGITTVFVYDLNTCPKNGYYRCGVWNLRWLQPIR